MAVYGEYEIVDELYRTPFGCVCSAKPFESPSNGRVRTEFVVKIYEPALQDGQTVDEAGGVAFLKRARLQHKAVTANASHWSRIHDLGVCENKPYYVTDYYPRTAQKLIAGRVVLQAPALHEIVTAVTSGLRELNQICNLPHGALKPSNVLIGGSGEVSGAKIVLSDPAGDSLDQPIDRSEDMFALGGLIYQLVMHRPFRHAAWPIDPSEEWRRLRGIGEKWRFLCSLLLNPDASQRPDQDTLDRSLAQLAPGRISVRNVARVPGAIARRTPFRKIAIAAAVAAVGIAGTGVYYHTMIAAAQQRVNVAQEAWLNALLADQAILQRYQALGEPIASQDQFSLPPTDAWWKSCTPARLRQVGAIESTVGQVRQQLGHLYRISQDRLGSIQSDFDRMGYTQASQFVATWTGAAQPDDARLVASINDRLALAERLSKNMRPVFPQLAGDLAMLAQSPSGDLRAFAAALNAAIPASALLNQGGWSLKPDLDALAQRILAVSGWPEQFDRERFINEQKSAHLDKPDLADVQLWLSKAAAYRFVQNVETIDSTVDQLNQRLKRITDEVERQLQWVEVTNTNSPLRAQFRKQKQDVDQQIEEFKTRRFVAADFPVKFNEEQSRIALAIDGLRLKNLPTTLQPGNIIEPWRKAEFGYAPLNEFWARRLALLPPAQNLNPAIIKQMNALQAFLQSLDCSDFEIPSQLGKTVWQPITEQRRDGQLSRILDLLDENLGGVPDSIVQAARLQFKTFRDQLVKLAADYPFRNNVILDAPSIQAIDRKWADGPDKVFWDNEVINGQLGKAIAPDLQRIARLREVLALNDPAKLTQTALDSNQAPEIILAAWSGLAATNPAPPTDAVGLQQQATLLANVRSAMDKLPTEAQPSYANQLKAVGTQAWQSVVKNAPAEDALEAAITLQQSLGVTDIGSLSSTDQFNLAICAGRLAGRAGNSTGVQQAADQLVKLNGALSKADQLWVNPLIAQLAKDAASAFATKQVARYLWPTEVSRRETAYALANQEEIAKQNLAIAAKIKNAAVALNDQCNPQVALRALEGLNTPQANDLRTLIQSLAKNRDTNYALGVKLFGGQNRSGAYAAFLDAAHAGDSRAMLNVGGMYRYNQGAPSQSLAEAEKWFKLAADHQLSDAMIELATLYQQKGNAQREADRWFTAAADSASAATPTDTASLDRIAKLELAGGWPSGPSIASALQKLPDDPFALTALGLLALNNKDVSGAGSWITKANDKDTGRKVPQLTEILRNVGQLLESSSPPAAAGFYQRAADRGDILSIAALGRIALEKQDLNTAGDWLGKADSADPGHAVPTIGLLLSRLAAAFSAAHQPDAASAWYQRAANRGDPTAQKWTEMQRKIGKSGSVAKDGGSRSLFDSKDAK